MRTIKFRAKRIDNNEWVYGDLFTSHEEHHSPCVSIALNKFNPLGYGSKTWHQVHPETVGQFMGFLDKNGKEIFEGDLLKDGYIEYPYTYEVYWDDRFQWSTRDFNTKEFNGSLSNDKYIVPQEYRVSIIGNIHDNN